MGSRGMGRPRNGARKMVQISPELLVMVYLMNLRILSKMRRPSLMALTMVAKLSSSRIMSSRFLGDIRSRDAHGNADIRPLQGRGIIHAVAGHGDELPSSWRARTIFSFCRGATLA